MTTEAVSQAASRVDSWLRANDYRGWDPYDGLSSPLGRRLPGVRPRQVVIQGVKRLHAGGRRLLRVPEHRMSKTLALVARALTYASWLPDADARSHLLIKELLERRGFIGWGYEFDVQTRWGFYPAGSPNVIVTAFTLEAVHSHLNQSEKESLEDWLTNVMWAGGHFRYVPGNDTCVHNANLLAARALDRLSPAHPLVNDAVNATLERLPANGLWPYGEARGLDWVDNFHTGYVLDALYDLVPSDDPRYETVREAAKRWIDTCFDDAAIPFYYAGHPGPVDVHNVATALHVARRTRDREILSNGFLSRLTSAALKLEKRPGEFSVGRGGITYPRWNQAHMLHALAGLT